MPRRTLSTHIRSGCDHLKTIPLLLRRSIDSALSPLANRAIPGSKREVYNDLDSSRREIRLLEILPSKSRSKGIRCRLHTVGLDDDPVYCAISYVWGDQSETRQDIVVNNGW